MHSVPPQALAFPVVLPRDAFGPRLVARAGAVWRAMQDVVVDQSGSVGWTPERYVAEDRMFIVRTMTVVHHREVRVGEALRGATWPSEARRDMLFTRQVRLFSQRDEALVATATQEWALLTRALLPTRAGEALYAAFTLLPGFPSATLPDFEPRAGHAVHHFTYQTWHTGMDPHAHLNHAAYLDACDEGGARLLASLGLDPQAAVPVAEQVHFRSALGPDAQVSVETVLKGRAEDAAVFGHRVSSGGKVCATATTVRRLDGQDGSWMDRLR